MSKAPFRLQAGRQADKTLGWLSQTSVRANMGTEGGRKDHFALHAVAYDVKDPHSTPGLRFSLMCNLRF